MSQALFKIAAGSAPQVQCFLDEIIRDGSRRIDGFEFTYLPLLGNVINVHYIAAGTTVVDALEVDNIKPASLTGAMRVFLIRVANDRARRLRQYMLRSQPTG